jgi:hypothetical protein
MSQCSSSCTPHCANDGTKSLFQTVWVVPVAECRFPPPWSVEEQDACDVVRDRGGQALAYVYFEGAPHRGQHRQDVVLSHTREVQMAKRN